MSDLLKKVQNTEYDILKELDRICKAHNIKYFIAQGTLLGAAKYKGFIPWDDDIDVIIPYKDLERLMDIFPAEGREEYMITNHSVEKHYPLPWAKIRAKNTLSRPVRYKDLPINWGICIDLFPLYPLSNNKLIRKLEVLSLKISYKLLMAEMTKYEDGHGMLVRLIEKTPICLRHFFFDMVVKMLCLHKDDSKYVWASCKGGRVLDRSLVFGEEKSLLFEDIEYPVPAKYHEYLTGFYGDYMAPLPESEQKGHELKMGDIEWKL